MRILIAEDEYSLSRAVSTLLRKNNYSVDAVDNGVDAIDYLRSDNYDAAILDVMMPGKDGITVLRELRAAGNHIPVLILTARSEVEDKVLGLDSGANDYLTKPFAASELLARLRAMTRTVPERGDNRLSAGNLTLDCATYELSAPGGSYRLSNKEFQLMELLMRHPGNIIQTEFIISRIWGFDTESDIGVVWAYISYLRKKLTAIEANCRITMKRGVGYLLEIMGEK